MTFCMNDKQVCKCKYEKHCLTSMNALQATIICLRNNLFCCSINGFLIKYGFVEYIMDWNACLMVLKDTF